MAKRIFKNNNIVTNAVVEDKNKEAEQKQEPVIEEVKEQVVDVPEPTWEELLVKDLNESILKFLSISKQAGWAVKYINPVLESYENGTVKLDENSYIGATLYIQFDFDNEYKK